MQENILEVSAFVKMIKNVDDGWHGKKKQRLKPGINPFLVIGSQLYSAKNRCKGFPMSVCIGSIQRKARL